MFYWGSPLNLFGALVVVRVPRFEKPKFKAKTNLKYIKTPSPYRAVNTLRLGYNNQSVNAVQGNNRCLFWDPHTKHINTVCGQNVELSNVKVAVHIVTTAT